MAHAADPRDAYLRVERKRSFAVVTLCREPVNTMNLAMWQHLAATLDELEADPKVRGVIFQSGLQRDVFTAGNDMMELYAPNTTQERYR
jgi:3,2-trans-enoyl-CoA isomerase